MLDEVCFQRSLPPRKEDPADEALVGRKERLEKSNHITITCCSNTAGDGNRSSKQILDY